MLLGFLFEQNPHQSNPEQKFGGGKLGLTRRSSTEIKPGAAQLSVSNALHDQRST